MIDGKLFVSAPGRIEAFATAGNQREPLGLPAWRRQCRTF
jgi:hypothetical protein